MELDKMVIKATGRQTVAHWISMIIHPVAFPLVTLGVITEHASGSLNLALKLALAALALTSLPVALLVVWQVTHDKWTDLDVSVRRQRYVLYPIGLFCTIAMVVAFLWLHAPLLTVGAALSLALANAVDGVINFAYKVSAHATGAAACAALLWFVPGWGVPATIAALLVGWSRVVLGRHTRGQVLLGWTVGAASAAAALLFL
ncbi:MAG: hypothetical protein ABI068_02695 [Ktedonobacterales bacterium]